MLKNRFFKKVLLLFLASEFFLPQISATNLINEQFIAQVKSYSKANNEALTINPQDLKTFEAKELVNINNLKEYQKACDEIDEFFEKYTQEKQNNYLLYYYKALALRGLVMTNRYGNNLTVFQAIECFKKANEINPNFINVHIDIGDLYRCISKYSDAYDEYLKGLESPLKRPDRGSSDATIYGFLGIVSYLLSINDNALNFFQKAIQLNPSDPSIYEGRASYYITKMQLAEAKNDLSMVQKLEPNNAIIDSELITIYYLEADYRNCLKTCLELLSYKNIPQYKAFGVVFGFMCYKQLGQQEIGQKLIKNYVNDPEIDLEYQFIFKYLAKIITVDEFTQQLDNSGSKDFRGKFLFITQLLEYNLKMSNCIDYILGTAYLLDPMHIFARAIAVKNHVKIPVLYKTFDN